MFVIFYNKIFFYYKMNKLPSQYPTETRSPYEILGIDSSSDMKTINETYKKLIKLLHPDKSLTLEAKRLGWTPEEKHEAFMLVQEAYKDILESRKYTDKQMNYPDIDIQYENMAKETVLGFEDIIDNFNNESFNSKYDIKRKQDAENGFDDPYQRGYDMFNSSSSEAERERIRKGGSRQDIEVLKNPEQIPRKLNNGALVNYDYFADQNCLTLGKCPVSELGLTKINDFSITITNNAGISLYGTDLMEVYGQNNETWEESVKRDPKLYQTYNDTTDISRKMNQYKSGRDVTIAIDDPIIKQEELRNKQMIQKMEQARNQHLQKEYEYYGRRGLVNLPGRS